MHKEDFVLCGCQLGFMTNQMIQRGFMLQFVEVRSGLGAGKHGTDKGVALLGEYIRAHHPDIDTITLTNDYQSNANHAHLKYADSLLPFYKTVASEIQDVAGRAIPVIIAGDHSNAAATLAGFKNAHSDKRVALIWIDAHADLHTVYTTPSGNMHGMPIASALALDNTDCSQHTPTEDEIAYWQGFKDLSKQDNLSIHDVFFLGLRSYEPPEAHILDKHQMFHYSTQAHRAHGFEQVLDKLVEKVCQADAVYVSFDVDSLDESLLAATGTREPEGYRVDEMKRIFDVILSLPNICAFEISEFNPTLHDDEREYQRVYELFLHAVNRLQQGR